MGWSGVFALMGLVCFGWSGQGTAVMIAPYVTHRLPQFWGDDVDEFKPQRFLDSAATNPAYMPFLMGSRSCIGARFAQMEMEVLLLLRRRTARYDGALVWQSQRTARSRGRDLQ